MAIFNSYVTNYQRVIGGALPCAIFLMRPDFMHRGSLCGRSGVCSQLVEMVNFTYEWTKVPEGFWRFFLHPLVIC